jgi:hypothetical protein
MFCDDFTRLHQGSLISIRMMQGDGVVDVVEDMPLERIIFVRQDACNNAIVITASEPGKRSIEHLIIDPFRFLVREKNECKELEIYGENGTTLIGFHSGKLPELVLSADRAFAARAAREGLYEKDQRGSD